jgi:hypothetical protein
MASMRIVSSIAAACVSGLFLFGCSSSEAGTASSDGGTTDGGGNVNDVFIPFTPDGGSTPPGTTGTPCTTNADCAGTNGLCRTKSHSGVAYPNGYCSSDCNPANDDPSSGIDPECSGALGTCLGSTAPGACLELCTGRIDPSGAAGMFPCRDGYSCFLATDISAVCLPTALSQCDPTQKGSCMPNDAGKGQTCVSVGLDPVGVCDDACDYFAQDCAPDVTDAGSTPRACYANSFGEGICDIAGAGTDGQPCAFLGDCAPGLGCHGEGGDGGPVMGVCRPYCGGASNKACTNGKACIDLSSTVTMATVGYCAG